MKAKKSQYISEAFLSKQFSDISNEIEAGKPIAARKKQKSTDKAIELTRDEKILQHYLYEEHKIAKKYEDLIRDIILRKKHLKDLVSKEENLTLADNKEFENSTRYFYEIAIKIEKIEEKDNINYDLIDVVSDITDVYEYRKIVFDLYLKKIDIPSFLKKCESLDKLRT